MWSIEIQSTAKKRLSRMSREERGRILRAIYGLKDNPFVHDLKPMRGLPLWRLRIGRWRVLLKLDIQKRTITILTVGARGDIYK